MRTDTLRRRSKLIIYTRHNIISEVRYISLRYYGKQDFDQTRLSVTSVVDKNKGHRITASLSGIKTEETVINYSKRQ